MTHKGKAHSCPASLQLRNRRQSGTVKVKNASPARLALGPQTVIGNVVGTATRNAIDLNAVFATPLGVVKLPEIVLVPLRNAE